MTLAENITPVLHWWTGKRPTVTLVCHCGAPFQLDQLEEARTHVEAHGGVDEPA